MRDDGIKNIVALGDTHCGGATALLPPGVEIDDGQEIGLSDFQKWLWESWQDFWRWVYRTLDHEPFAFVHLGDMIDGRHHGTTQLISGNLAVQQKIAIKAFGPIVFKARKSFFIRGTEAHVGASAETEEMIARTFGLKTQWDLWIALGDELIHFSHHIPTTTSTAYKSSPLMRLMAASFAAAGEHRFRSPTILVRGHCHDYTEVKRPHCRVSTCPSWQGKTGFTWRFSTIEPMTIGGLLIRLGKEGVHIRERLYTEPRPQPIRL